MSLPQSLSAEDILASPLMTDRMTGDLLCPVIIIPSKPARFNSGPKLPPQAASPQIPVCGDLAATAKRDDPGNPLPTSGPFMTISGLSGARGSAFRLYLSK